MIGNFHHYVQGTVTLTVSGPLPEKFINLCMMNKIDILRISKEGADFIVCIKLQDFFVIRPLVRTSKNKIKVIGYWGLPFVTRKIKRRKMLVFGGILFLVLINIMMSCLWFVDIVGSKDIPRQRIEECVYQYGLKPGVLKEGISTKYIENQLLLAIPEVAWVSINFMGTRAVVEIVEKTVPKEFDKAPADIIAGKDGIITEIITLVGQSMVKKGDTVKKGDVLIKGVVSPLPLQLVRASGIVKARVWYEGYGEGELVAVRGERTGRKVVGIQLRILQYEIPLKIVNLDSTDNFEVEVVNKKLSWWRNRSIAVESIISNYYEVAPKWVERSVEEAREIGKNKALAEVQSLIPETAQVLSRNIEVLKTPESNVVRVKVYIETAEDIGQFMNIP